MSESWRKIVHRLIEAGPECYLGKRTRKMVDGRGKRVGGVLLIAPIDKTRWVAIMKLQNLQVLWQVKRILATTVDL